MLGTKNAMWREDFRIFGTGGSYSYGVVKKNGRVEALPEVTPKPVEQKEYTEAEMRDPLPAEVREAFKKVYNPDAKPEDDFEPLGFKFIIIRLVKKHTMLCLL